MKKKTILTYVVIVILVISFGVGVFFIMDKTNKDNDTEPKNEHPQETESPIEYVIDPLPQSLFNDTNAKFENIEFAVKHQNETVFDLSHGSKVKDFNYDFTYEMDDETKAIIDEVLPGKTMLEVKYDTEAIDDTFVVGGVNLTQEKTKDIDIMDTVYVSYQGSAAWSLCGVNTSMSVEDVEETLGTPSSAYEQEKYYYMYYYLERDGHQYMITVTFDKEKTKMQSIEWLKDNLPIFENQIVPY